MHLNPPRAARDVKIRPSCHREPSPCVTRKLLVYITDVHTRVRRIETQVNVARRYFSRPSRIARQVLLVTRERIRTRQGQLVAKMGETQDRPVFVSALRAKRLFTAMKLNRALCRRETLRLRASA